MQKDWEFPEDVIIDRAMIEALVAVLTRHNLINSKELREEFQRRLQDHSADASSLQRDTSRRNA